MFPCETGDTLGCPQFWGVPGSCGEHAGCPWFPLVSPGFPGFLDIWDQLKLHDPAKSPREVRSSEVLWIGHPDLWTQVDFDYGVRAASILSHPSSLSRGAPSCSLRLKARA